MSAVSVAELAQRHQYLNPKNLWDNFTYSLIANKNLPKGTYEVSLELVAKK